MSFSEFFTEYAVEMLFAYGVFGVVFFAWIVWDTHRHAIKPDIYEPSRTARRRAAQRVEDDNRQGSD